MFYIMPHKSVKRLKSISFKQNAHFYYLKLRVFIHVNEIYLHPSMLVSIYTLLLCVLCKTQMGFISFKFFTLALSYGIN